MTFILLLFFSVLLFSVWENQVVILSVRGTLVRKFMLAAYSLGMTNGDWVFLDVEIFQVSGQKLKVSIIGIGKL